MARPRLDVDTDEFEPEEDLFDAELKRRYSEVPGFNGDTVTVMCKLPNGLVLRNFHMVDDYEPVLGGGSRQIRRAEPIPGSEWRINGAALNLEKIGKALLPGYIITPEGYAMTTGVPKVIWDGWVADNKDSPYVRNRIVFAEAEERRARGRARQYGSVRSGLEPVDPEQPSRVRSDVGKGPNRTGIQPFDEKQEVAA